ncbi:MAG: GNAT family N-acetyltransferase [Treponema sp.]|jgi:GNAT superfamily N-acetyltransferase|nr:GNAT family N-acetyltransferase [Treponema sp.]
MRKSDDVISLLEKFAPSSLSAYTHFENMKDGRDRVWVLGKGKNGVLIQSRRSLYPVFDYPCLSSEGEAERLKDLKNILKKPFENAAPYAIQGIAENVEFLEKAIGGLGVFPEQRTLYDLMVIKWEPSAASLNTGPAGLILRTPCMADIEPLFELQTGYEKEEVLTEKSVFVPAVCRLLVERSVRGGQVLLAEYGARVVGKVNVNAVSPTWAQIGGVYVLPEFRGMGIASRMVAVFVRGLLPGRTGVSLFAKRTNAPARAVYRRIGFAPFDPYRISYY